MHIATVLAKYAVWGFLLIAFSFLNIFTSANLKSGVDSRPNLTATVTGAVTIPAGQQQQRSSRGRAYRSRSTSSSNSGETESEMANNPYLNTIISAHPVSYDLDAEPLEEPARIDQENATFIPHVTPVTVGSTVQFVNSDPFFHNVFSLTPGAKFNIGRKATGVVVDRKIPRTNEVQITGLGEIQIFCDIHSDMNAVILSLNTPYFSRVNEDGTYRLEGLPAGQYELRAYNPRFNVITTEITVEENGSVERNFNFSS